MSTPRRFDPLQLSDRQLSDAVRAEHPVWRGGATRTRPLVTRLTRNRQHQTVQRRPFNAEVGASTRDQAYVPAEQPSSAQDARLPPAHAHSGRPRHRGRPPAQGPRPACCLIATVLPRAHRLRRSAEFGQVVRRGQRAGAPSLVVHASLRDDLEPVRVGFVVGRAVGNAVHRNTVKRRLRQLMSERLNLLPDHASVVVRANPAAAAAGFSGLRDDLDSCLGTVSRRLARP
jgi:ribonuclease P protein component